MFSLACNLTKNNVEFLPVEISSKKVQANNVGFSIIKITWDKVGENSVNFLTRDITSEKCVETTWVVRPSKLNRKKYLEKM